MRPFDVPHVERYLPMRPRDDLVREFASLVVWWALWSLWDAYLLDFTPLFELTFLGALATYNGARWVRERRALAHRRQWSTAWLDEADGEPPCLRLRPHGPARRTYPLRRAFLGFRALPHKPRAHGEHQRVAQQEIHKRVRRTRPDVVATMGREQRRLLPSDTPIKPSNSDKKLPRWLYYEQGCCCSKAALLWWLNVTACVFHLAFAVTTPSWPAATALPMGARAT